MAFDLAQVELEREEAERKYNELWNGLTPDARTLVDPEGPLSPTATSSLAAVARRPLLRRLLLGPSQLAHQPTRGRQEAAPRSQPRPHRPRPSRCTSATRTRSTCDEQLRDRPDSETTHPGAVTTARPRNLCEEALQRVDAPLPRVVRRRLDPRASEPLAAARGRRAAAASAAADRARRRARASGSSRHRTQKSRLPCASVQTTAPPVAIDSSGGSAKPSCVEVCTNTRRLVEQLVDLLVAGATRT